MKLLNCSRYARGIMLQNSSCMGTSIKTRQWNDHSEKRQRRGHQISHTGKLKNSMLLNSNHSITQIHAGDTTEWTLLNSYSPSCIDSAWSSYCLNACRLQNNCIIKDDQCTVNTRTTRAAHDLPNAIKWSKKQVNGVVNVAFMINTDCKCHGINCDVTSGSHSAHRFTTHLKLTANLGENLSRSNGNKQAADMEKGHRLKKINHFPVWFCDKTRASPSIRHFPVHLNHFMLPVSFLADTVRLCNPSHMVHVTENQLVCVNRLTINKNPTCAIHAIWHQLLAILGSPHLAGKGNLAVPHSITVLLWIHDIRSWINFPAFHKIPPCTSFFLSIKAAYSIPVRALQSMLPCSLPRSTLPLKMTSPWRRQLMNM